MTDPIGASEKALRSRLNEMNERVREHESLVQALQAGEVDAVVVQQKDGDSVYWFQSDEPLYRTIVDALPQAVSSVLSDGTMIYLNRHLAELIGSSDEKLRGRNLLDFVAEEDQPAVTAMLTRALVSPQEGGVTFRWVAGEAPAVVSAMRLPISGVDAVGLVIMDVSDQVARRAAEESSRAKDELIASVSHELRTPLTSIVGWINLLEMELAGQERVADPLKHLKNAVMAETKIVDDLLDLARSERGSLSLSMKTFDLREPLRMAASFVSLQAQNKSVSLSVTVPDEALITRGDPDRLRQVFVNLLSNAVKFTSEGDVSLRAGREDGLAVIEVKDSGIGIAPDFLPLVFEAFRRADKALGYPGLGIGLAISRRLVEAHGGSIEVASEGLNRGSTFIVRLPLT